MVRYGNSSFASKSIRLSVREVLIEESRSE